MHTALTRANALAAYTMSVLASLTFLCFLSTFFNEYQVHADINTVKVVVKNVPDYAAGKEKNDLGFLTFDLQVEFHETIFTIKADFNIFVGRFKSIV